MKKRKTLSPFKKFMIVAGSLIVIQVIFLLFFAGGDAPLDPKSAIKKAIQETKGMTPEKQVLLALNQFRSENKGKLPKSLQELIPKYMDAVPKDPGTGKAIDYRIENNKPIVGSGGKGGPGGAEGETGSEREGLSQEGIQLVLNTIKNDPRKSLPLYDPAGKRDPFRPFDPNPRKGVDDARDTLETYQLSDLRLTAVIDGLNEPSASVETPEGLGFIVKKGSKIGINKGEVVEILPDRLRIIEKLEDFTGQDKSRTVEIFMKPGASGRGAAPGAKPPGSGG